MAKEKEDPERKEKKEKDKKDKREKRRSETDGVSKEKRSKKEKKGSKHADDATITQNGGADAGAQDPVTAVLNKVDAEKPGSLVVKSDGVRKEGDADVDGDRDQAMVDVDVDGQGRVIKADWGKGNGERDAVTAMVKAEAGRGALVPFANPLADEKAGKKVLKGVRKAAKNKTLKRGVKEVVKALRKSANNSSNPTITTTPLPHAIVILAADISPMDVISHIPVLCEDHNVPYLFVPSRAELGAAGATKRPTSVIMVMRDRAGGAGARKKGKEGEEGKGEKKEGDTEEEWNETYRELVKVADKLGRSVRI